MMMMMMVRSNDVFLDYANVMQKVVYNLLRGKL